MTVAELIERLATLDPDTLIVVSSDAEGNTFSPLDPDVSVGRYRPETTWYGTFEETEDESTQDDAVACVALWPMN